MHIKHLGEDSIAYRTKTNVQIFKGFELRNDPPPRKKIRILISLSYFEDFSYFKVVEPVRDF